MFTKRSFSLPVLAAEVLINLTRANLRDSPATDSRRLRRKCRGTPGITVRTNLRLDVESDPTGVGASTAYGLCVSSITAFAPTPRPLRES